MSCLILILVEEGDLNFCCRVTDINTIKEFSGINDYFLSIRKEMLGHLVETIETKHCLV